MKLLAAVVVGYVVGARTGSEDLQRFSRSVRALCETDEFADMVASGRQQLGRTLHELAALLDGPPEALEGHGDLVARVRTLVGHQ